MVGARSKEQGYLQEMGKRGCGARFPGWREPGVKGVGGDHGRRVKRWWGSGSWWEPGVKGGKSVEGGGREVGEQDSQGGGNQE